MYAIGSAATASNAKAPGPKVLVKSVFAVLSFLAVLRA